MKHLLLIILFISNFENLLAQKNEWNSHHPIEYSTLTKLKPHLERVVHLTNILSDSNRYELKKCRELFDQEKDSIYTLAYNYEYIKAYFDSSDKKELLQYTREAKAIAEGLNYLYYQVTFLDIEGRLLLIEKKNTLAFKIFTEAYELSKKLELPNRRIIILQALLNIPGETAQIESIKNLLRIELKLMEENNQIGEVFPLANFILLKLGLTKNYQDGLKTIKQGNKFLTDYPLNKNFTARFLTRKAIFFSEFREYDKSINSFLDALRFGKTINSTAYIANIYLRLADVSYAHKSYEKAQHYFEEFKKHLNKNVQTNIDYNRLGYLIYKINGNNKLALTYMEKNYNSIKSARSENIDSLYTELSERYKNDLLESKLIVTKLKSENSTKISQYQIALLLLVLFTVLLLFYFKIKVKDRSIQFKEKALFQEKEMNKFRKRFIENINHEIRNPLSTISGVLEYFQKEEVTTTKSSEAVKLALSNCHLVKDSFENALQIIQKDKLPEIEKLEPLTLIPLLIEKLKSFDYQFKTKGLRLNLEHNLTNESIFIFRKEWLMIIIDNLFSNAIKFSKQESEINFRLKYESEQKQFNFEIQDFGMGIPEQDLDRIFERFYQASNAHSGGFGIGLSIVQNLVKDSGGEISIFSTENLGTTVKITFQSTIIEKFHPITQKISFFEDKINLNIQKNKTNKNILIIDDNQSMLDYYNLILSDQYNCTLLLESSQTLEYINNDSYDCIIMDLMMPQLNGYQLLELLSESQIKIPVIMISAVHSEEAISKSFKLGTRDFLSKPFYNNELYARIDNLIVNNENVINDIELLSENEENTFINTEIDKIKDIINLNISDSEFGVKKLAEVMAYSESKLYKMIKINCHLSPVKLILEFRLLHAFNLIEKSTYPTLIEVQNEIGIKSTAYFNKVFKTRFGITPKILAKKSKLSSIT